MDVIRSHFCDEKSVQLVRGASFRSDFLQNPYFSGTLVDKCIWYPKTISSMFKP